MNPVSYGRNLAVSAEPVNKTIVVETESQLSLAVKFSKDDNWNTAIALATQMANELPTYL